MLGKVLFSFSDFIHFACMQYAIMLLAILDNHTILAGSFKSCGTYIVTTHFIYLGLHLGFHHVECTEFLDWSRLYDDDRSAEICPGQVNNIFILHLFDKEIRSRSKYAET